MKRLILLMALVLMQTACYQWPIQGSGAFAPRYCLARNQDFYNYKLPEKQRYHLLLTSLKAADKRYYAIMNSYAPRCLPGRTHRLSLSYKRIQGEMCAGLYYDAEYHLVMFDQEMDVVQKWMKHRRCNRR